MENSAATNSTSAPQNTDKSAVMKEICAKWSKFSEQDVAFLQSLANTLGLAIDRERERTAREERQLQFVRSDRLQPHPDGGAVAGQVLDYAKRLECPDAHTGEGRVTSLECGRETGGRGCQAIHSSGRIDDLRNDFRVSQFGSVGELETPTKSIPVHRHSPD